MSEKAKELADNLNDHLDGIKSEIDRFTARLANLNGSQAYIQCRMISSLRRVLDHTTYRDLARIAEDNVD